MAEREETRVLNIKVEYKEAINGIVGYKKQIQALKDEEKSMLEVLKEMKKGLKDGSVTQEEYNEKLQEYDQMVAANKIQMKEYSDAIRALEKEVRNNIHAQTEQEGSLKALRAELSNLTAEYDSLGNSEAALARKGELKDKINAITDQIKGSEEATQRYYRNVGNYENAITHAFGKLRDELQQATDEYERLVKTEGEHAEVTQRAKKHMDDLQLTLDFTEQASEELNASVLGFATAGNPWAQMALNMVRQGKSLKGVMVAGAQGVMALGKQFLALMAIPVVAVLSAIAAAVMAVSKGISGSEENTNRWRMAMAPFKIVLDAVANALTWFAGKILTVVEYGGQFLGWVNKMMERLPVLGKAFEEQNKKIEERVRLEKMQIANEQAVRKEIEESAKRENEIAQLRAKVTDRENYTAKERKAALEEAIRLEKESAEIKRKLAADQLAALELEGSLTENDAEMNNRLAEARANVTRAETEYFNKVREMNAQRTELNNQIAKEEKERLEREVLNNKRREQALQESAIVFTNILKEQEETVNELLKPIGMEQLQTDLDARVEAERASAEQRIAIAEREAEAKLAMQEAVATGIEAMEELGGDFARVAKVLALAQIAIDTGKALAAGIAQAQSVPFPANIAAVATTVATILANIAAAKKAVQSAKFATGGLVTGAGSGTSDSIQARLSNGESVMTARATEMFAPLLSTLNQIGGGIPITMIGHSTSVGEDMLASAVAKGMIMAPTPVVSVEEINRVQKRVNILEQLGSIG